MVSTEKRTYAIFIEAPNRAKAAVLLHERTGGAILELAELLEDIGPPDHEDADYTRNEWESD